MIFWPSSQICEHCAGMGRKLWYTEKIRPKVKWIECFVCHGFGSLGWIGPKEIIVHKLKIKKPRKDVSSNS